MQLCLFYHILYIAMREKSPLEQTEGYLKQYPNHPETGVSGLLQVETVPSGNVSYQENGKIVLFDLRVRNSESLTRYKCNAE